MKTSHLLTLAALVGTLLPPAALAAPASGTLIKGSGDAVYYFGADGKRYVFPTAKTYFSWYADFSGVLTIPDAELATYPLGGNVTYRPGVRLVKVTTDPKTYAVAKNGELRWIQSEAAATALYGADWAKKVDDLPDAFFVNYHLEASIATSADFSPSTVTGAATSINADKNIGQPTPTPTPTPTPEPTPTPTSTVSGYTGTITISGETPRATGLITIQGTPTSPQLIQSVRLYFNQTLMRTCTTLPCNYTQTLPNTSPATHAVHAEFSWTDGHASVADASVAVADSTSQLELIHLTADHKEIRPNGIVTFTVYAESQIRARKIDIYVDGVRLQNGCADTQSCYLSYTDGGSIGTLRSVEAFVTDDVHVQRTVSTTYAIVTNDHPLVTLSTDKTRVALNGLVDVNVTSRDDDGIASTDLYLNGTLLRHCAGSTCGFTYGPVSSTTPLLFTARALDSLGLETTASAPTVRVE